LKTDDIKKTYIKLCKNKMHVYTTSVFNTQSNLLVGDLL
jgi:hypothetical protein